MEAQFSTFILITHQNVIINFYILILYVFNIYVGYISIKVVEKNGRHIAQVSLQFL